MIPFVPQRLAALIEATRADELMLTAQISDHAARARTDEIADVRNRWSLEAR